jgi:cytochrome b subunit of formate dehydrogenase
VHWVHAAAFVVLLGSGLCLYLPSLAEAVGRRPLLKTIHVYTALAWIAALLLVVAVGDRRSLRATVHELDFWDSDDRAWFMFLGHLYLSVIHPRTRHSLVGITRGWVDEDWALAHHRKWAEQQPRLGGPEH